MKRLMTISFCCYWTVGFSVSAFAFIGVAAGNSERFAGWTPVRTQEIGLPWSHIALGLLFALCAALFAWAALSSILLSSRQQKEVDDATRVAIGASCLALTIQLILAAFSEPLLHMLMPLLLIAGLGATYAAIIAERIHFSQLAASVGRAKEVRLMAVSAAHQTLLPRLLLSPDAFTPKEEN